MRHSPQVPFTNLVMTYVLTWPPNKHALSHSRLQFSLAICTELKSHSIQPHHFMANRCGNNGNSERLYFFGSKITTFGDCSHEIKRHLVLGRKAVTNLDSILKNRDITLPINVHLIKVMVFPVIMMDVRVGL